MSSRIPDTTHFLLEKLGANAVTQGLKIGAWYKAYQCFFVFNLNARSKIHLFFSLI